MRPFLSAATLAAICFTPRMYSQTTNTATPHRPVTGANAHRRTGPTASAKAGAPTNDANSEGLAAAGTMPAAAGPSKPLFTLRYVDLVIGTGELAKPRRFYTVQYTGWTTDGKKFDSSYDAGQPFTFAVGARRVIIGWDTGFEGMRVGGKRRLIVPYQLAYGENGHPPEIPAKADLIFDVELVSQNDPDAPPQSPATPSQPPATQSQPPATQSQPHSGTAPGSATPAPQPGTNPVTDPKDQTNKPATQPATQPPR